MVGELAKAGDVRVGQGARRHAVHELAQAAADRFGLALEFGGIDGAQGVRRERRIPVVQAAAVAFDEVVGAAVPAIGLAAPVAQAPATAVTVVGEATAVRGVAARVGAVLRVTALLAFRALRTLLTLRALLTLGARLTLLAVLALLSGLSVRVLLISRLPTLTRLQPLQVALTIARIGEALAVWVIRVAAVGIGITPIGKPLTIGIIRVGSPIATTALGCEPRLFRLRKRLRATQLAELGEQIFRRRVVYPFALLLRLSNT